MEAVNAIAGFAAVNSVEPDATTSDQFRGAILGGVLSSNPLVSFLLVQAITQAQLPPPAPKDTGPAAGAAPAAPGARGGAPAPAASAPALTPPPKGGQGGPAGGPQVVELDWDRASRVIKDAVRSGVDEAIEEAQERIHKIEEAQERILKMGEREEKPSHTNAAPRKGAS